MSKLVLKGDTLVYCLSWILTFVVGLSTLSYVTIPMISIIYQHSHNIQPIQYTLVYPTGYPWSIDPPGFRYKIHFIIESVATLALFCITVGIDSLFTLYGWQMVAQFREMSHRITHISDKDDTRNVLRECVLQHQKMIKCRDILQKIYGPVILWIITTNAVILCSLLFQFSQVKSIGRGISFLTYIMLKLMQTFMYSWTGTQLTTASDDYRDAVYAANWYQDKSLMSSFLIILTQKPLILTACNFSNVTLDMFIMVLNTTISYFFLLRTLEENV
uniref:Olfactory receptor 9 n=1 Tax=Meteorus pulchricornis TaxID=51522 RepID=A0A1S5VFJ6_9HYME|nr:olfactory receptor 9 [Meteorus pulchricornis]